VYEVAVEMGSDAMYTEFPKDWFKHSTVDWEGIHRHSERTDIA
jgi:hypothetical protein